MEPAGIFFLTILGVVAFLYASVGHGGASGYLGLMGLFGVATVYMRPSALMLNLFVAGLSFYHFYRGGHFRVKLFIPFALASIPMAFLGAKINLDPIWYKRLLAICLVFATLRMVGLLGINKGQSFDDYKGIKWIPALIAGGLIGLFSGMIGIGGGIILSPVILLLGWGNIKETAAVSALFILVNSTSGLIGLISQGAEFAPKLFMWVSVAALGGFLGSYQASLNFKPGYVKNLLAMVLAMASFKLLFI